MWRALVCCVILGLSCAQAWSQDKKAQDGTPPIDSDPRLAFQYGKHMRFGLTLLKDAAGKVMNKKLTFSADGETNSTVVRIDGKDFEFGTLPGVWLEKNTKIPNGSKSVWKFEGVQIAQIVEIVPSNQPVKVGSGASRRILDTCLIRYEIENMDEKKRKVGLRIQVDTLIGSNDGVPFAVPGLPGLVTTFKDFPRDIPDFVEALEKPNLQKPGTVGHMSFRVGGTLEAPDRVSLTHWPGYDFVRWEVPVVPMKNDSAVVLYWYEKDINSNQKRSLGFSYGYGSGLSSAGTGLLRLTLDGTFFAGELFTVLARVQNPLKDQTLTLALPAGLERAAGLEKEAVPPAMNGSSVLTWKVKAPKPGDFTFKVQSSTGLVESKTVTILPPPPNVEPPALETSRSPAQARIFDAQRALKMSVGLMPEDLRLDLDGDGRVTSHDASLILQRRAIK